MKVIQKTRKVISVQVELTADEVKALRLMVGNCRHDDFESLCKTRGVVHLAEQDLDNKLYVELNDIEGEMK